MHPNRHPLLMSKTPTKHALLVSTTLPKTVKLVVLFVILLASVTNSDEAKLSSVTGPGEVCLIGAIHTSEEFLNSSLTLLKQNKSWPAALAGVIGTSEALAL